MENAKKRTVLKIPAKASAWYVASSAVSRAIGALATPIFTRLLTPEEYGIYPLYNTWLGVISVVVTLELTGAAFYRGLQKHEDEPERFISSTLGLIFTLALAFGTIYAIFYRTINGIIGLSTPMVSLMLTQILASAILSLYTAKARFEYKYKTVAAINILTSIGSPLLAVFLISKAGVGGEARIIASSLVLALISIPIAFKILSASGAVFSPTTWKYLLRHAVPMLPHYLSTSLILKVGEIGINRIYGKEALGKFSVALSVGMSMTVVTGGLLSALSPWIIRRVKDGSYEKVRELLLVLTKLIALSSLWLLAFAPEVMAILASASYGTALPAVYPIALSLIPTFLSGAIVSGSVYFEKSRLTALPSVIAATLSVLLTVIVLPIADYRYVSLFLLASYTVLAALNTLIFKRMANESPINVRGTLFVFLGACAYGALLFIFRGALLSRFFFTLPLALPLLSVCREALRLIKE